LRRISNIVAHASLRDFVNITKPRIIMSNLIAAFGGFWVASQWIIDWSKLFYMLLGSALIMASSCVFNNYWDRDLDKKMMRTSQRPLPTGKMNPAVVLGYGILLGVVGTAILLWRVNPLTAVLGLVGIFFYVVVYTIWLKRTSTWSTSIGGVSGAMPPVIGYCAVTSEVDIGAWLLFAFLFLWQPPHFWALGIRRKEEYRAAGYPLLPVVKGVKRTKIQMIPYIVLLIPTTVLFYTYHYVGVIFLITAVVLGIVWLVMGIAGFWTKNDDVWSGRMFMFSVNYLMILFIIMVVDTVRA
jgi:protoheme IX farnesyltransferase